MLSSVYTWARRTTSSFADLVASGNSRGSEPREGEDELIYRLKEWPWIPQRRNTANLYRTLSVMTQRPVNRRWMLAQSKMEPRELDPLLKLWVEKGWLEVIDPRKFKGKR